jgi:hypothetical protein
MTANNIAPIISERLLFRVLFGKVEQQWVELHCTDVGADVKKDSVPYTFVHPAKARRIAANIPSCRSFCVKT